MSYLLQIYFPELNTVLEKNHHEKAPAFFNTKFYEPENVFEPPEPKYLDVVLSHPQWAGRRRP